MPRPPEQASRFIELMADAQGASAIEYALIAALIAVASVGAWTSTGERSAATLNNAASAMPAPGQSVTVNDTP